MIQDQPDQQHKGIINPQESDYELRLQAALDELDNRGVWKSNSRPPYFRLARRMGWPIKPPYYSSIAFNATFSCALFGFFWGVIMWIFVWSHGDISIKEALFSTLNIALIVGLLTSMMTYASVRFRRLTPWDKLLENQNHEPD